MHQRIKPLVTAICLVFIFAGCTKNIDNIGSSTTTIPALKEVTENNNMVSTPYDNCLDLKEYFQGISGCAVIYDENKNIYNFYNQELTEKRSSPLSTFKIISTLIGLDSDVLQSKDTLVSWDGIQYPVEDWNHDMTLEQAFKSSCVWYFRDVIDRVGKEEVQKALDELSYGNCDISQWQGSNVNNGYEKLNGFWLESSLLISPKEQVDILQHIFSNETSMREKNINILKDIMEIDNFDNIAKVYGKTGTGYRGNAWFIGMANKENNVYYFAIRLDDSNSDLCTGSKAKEIAINIINEHLK